jgi:hypothetical protein
VLCGTREARLCGARNAMHSHRDTETHSCALFWSPETKGKGKGTKASKHKENGKGQKKRCVSCRVVCRVVQA